MYALLFFFGIIPHKANYVIMHFDEYLTSQEPQFLNSFSMYFPCFHGINSRCVYTTMTEDVDKVHDVLLQAIISACEKMT